MRARVRRTRPHTRSSRQRWGGRDRAGEEVGRGGRAGCTGVNYASREMSNCSPYRKIYNSARCGKHYVPGPFSSPPLAAPSLFPLPPPSSIVLPSTTRVSPNRACPPSHTGLPHPRYPVFLARFSPPRASRPSRFANKFARRTAIVLTSKRLRMQPPRNLFFCRSRYNRVVTRGRISIEIIRDKEQFANREDSIHFVIQF